MPNTKITLSLILGIFMLSAISVPAKNVRPPKKTDLDIVFIGNSITYGANLAHPETDAPPVAASAFLRKMAGIGLVNFSNQGRSGYTTVNFLPGGETFQEVVRATRGLNTNTSHTLVFSIKLGTNDSAIEGPLGAPVSGEDYRKNMVSIIDELIKLFPESKVVIQQPVWYSPNTQNGAKYLEEGLKRLQSYFPEIKSIVKSYASSHPGQVLMGDQSGFEYFRKNYLTDLVPEEGKQGIFYLHPNEKGAAQLGRFWAEAIYKAMK